MRIHICDPDLMFAEALSLLLSARGHEVTMSTGSPLGLSIPPVVPDVVITDLDAARGCSYVQQVRELDDSIPIVVLTETSDALRLHEVVLAGANGIVLKSEGVDELAQVASRAVERRASSRQQTTLRPAEWSQQARRIREDSERARRRGRDVVTPRERAVLERLVRGQSAAAIAGSLGVSVTTVRTHLQSLFLKFGVHSSLGLIARAIRDGAVEVGGAYPGSAPGRFLGSGHRAPPDRASEAICDAEDQDRSADAIVADDAWGPTRRPLGDGRLAGH